MIVHGLTGSRWGKGSWAPASCILWALCALMSALTPTLARGQSRSVPGDTYYRSFAPFFDGDYALALRAFRDAARDGYVSVEGRWVDSICYHTMRGECYFELGQYAQALEEYDASCKIFLAYRDWLLRVEFPPGVEPDANQRPGPTWGPSQRQARMGRYPNKYQVLLGRLDNAQVAQQGGVIVPPSLHPADVIEIVRCTALAISRRREIMGPVCEHDPLTNQLVAELSRRPSRPNHWSQCFVSLQLGCALAAANKPVQAISEFNLALLAGGNLDHPLTGMALLELGKLHFEQFKYDVAGNLFYEATLTAAWFDRVDVAEEAFRYAALCHQLTGGKGVFPPLTAAAAWAQQKRYRVLRTSLLLSLAENLAASEQPEKAQPLMSDALAALGRAEAKSGRLGARLNYDGAQVLLTLGRDAPAAASLASALKFQTQSSLGLFQISLADLYFTRGTITERVADLVFAAVLREPTAVDWKHDPLDTLAVHMTPHPVVYEHWVELCLSRKEYEKALEIGDRLRRHRFFCSLPSTALGGRLLALRWLLESPEEALEPAAQLQRKDLLLRYPQYEQLARDAAALTAQLDPLPAAGDEAQTKLQAELQAKLAAVSAVQERWLTRMALARLPAEQVFPPLKPVKQVQQQLAPGTLAVAFLQTSRSVHAFALTKDQYAYFTLQAPTKVKADVADLLKRLGCLDRNQPLPAESLSDASWQAPAGKLLAQLTNDARPEEWKNYRELVIVPDGVLWYLPFELLPIPLDGATALVAERVNVRYAPFLSLAVPDARPHKPLARTLIAAGKLLPGDAPEVALETAREIAGVLPDTGLTQELAAPSSLIGGRCERLLVLTDLDDVEKSPFAWAPVQLDRGQPGAALFDWLALPWRAPDQIILPGFHTPAETALRRGGTGDEVFLTLCGLMSSGARTVVLSRWRVGGRTTTDLLREFVQELPHDAPAAALRRAIQIVRESRLDPAREPRLKAAPQTENLRPDHPFFWAPYLLVDLGGKPVK